MVRAGCFELCDGSGGKLMSLFTPSLVAMSINGSFELGNGLERIQKWLPLLLAHVLLRDQAVPALN